jgi:hypothetical protein
VLCKQGVTGSIPVTSTIHRLGFIRSDTRYTFDERTNVFAEHRYYQSNFNPNWTCRDVVVVALITPAVGEGPPVADAYTTGFGALKLV